MHKICNSSNKCQIARHKLYRLHIWFAYINAIIHYKLPLLIDSNPGKLFTMPYLWACRHHRCNLCVQRKWRSRVRCTAATGRAEQVSCTSRLTLPGTSECTQKTPGSTWTTSAEPSSSFVGHSPTPGDQTWKLNRAHNKLSNRPESHRLAALFQYTN